MSTSEHQTSRPRGEQDRRGRASTPSLSGPPSARRRPRQPAYPRPYRHRNNSLLAHGFQAITPGKDAQVLKALDLLEQLFRSESPADPRILKNAQFSWLLV